MTTTVAKGIQEQIVFAFTNTDLTVGQILYRTGVSQSTVQTIGKEIFGNNFKSEMERRIVQFREQISQLKLKGLSVNKICVQPGCTVAYYYKNYKDMTDSPGKSLADAGRAIEALPALEQDAQDDDEQEVNIISICGTPLEAAFDKSRTRLPAQKIKEEPKALGQDHGIDAGTASSNIVIKAGNAELKFNLDELNPQRIETLCCLIERLGKGDLR